jgi:hypothetical protein
VKRGEFVWIDAFRASRESAARRWWNEWPARIEDAAVLPRRDCVAGETDHALDPQRSRRRVLQQDQVPALRRVRLVRVYVGKDAFANAKCWTHGSGGNFEGSEREIGLQVENRDRGSKRGCQDRISEPGHWDRRLGRFAGCRGVCSVRNYKEAPRYGEHDQ